MSVCFLSLFHTRLIFPSVSLMLVNRMVLNLRRASNSDDNTLSSLAVLSFAEPTDSILENIGVPLREGSEDHDCEGEVADPNEVQPGKE